MTELVTGQFYRVQPAFDSGEDNEILTNVQSDSREARRLGSLQRIVVPRRIALRTLLCRGWCPR